MKVNCISPLAVQSISSHTPHYFEVVRIMFMNRPWDDSSLIINIHNLFMYCATSLYVFKPRDVIMLICAVTIVAA